MSTQGKQLIKKSAFMIVIMIAAYLANFYLNVFLARFLQAKTYGSFAVYKEIILLATFLLLLGSNFAVLRFLPTYIETKQWSHARSYLLYDIKKIFKTGLSLLIMATVLFLLSKRQPCLAQHNALYLAVWAITLSGIATYLTELLRSLKHTHLATTLSDLTLPILFSIFLIGIHYQYRTLSLPLTLAAYSLTFIVIICVQGWFIHRSLPPETKTAPPLKKLAEWRRAAIPLMTSKFLLTLLFSSQILLLKLFGNDPADVGRFAAILAIGSLYWLTFNAITYVISPQIAPIAHTKDIKQLQQLFNHSTLLLLALIISLSITLFCLRVVILRHFGMHFTAGSSALTIVIIGYTVTAIFGLPWYFLGLTGHQQQLLSPTIVLVILSVIGTSLLIHFYQLNGAALGLAITDVLLASWLALSMKHHLGIRPFLFF